MCLANDVSKLGLAFDGDIFVSINRSLWFALITSSSIVASCHLLRFSAQVFNTKPLAVSRKETFYLNDKEYQPNKFPSKRGKEGGFLLL